MLEFILFIIAVVIFIFTVMLNSVLYKIKNKDKYSLLNHFPFELINDKWGSVLVIFIISILIISNGIYFLITPSNHVNYFLSNVIGVLFVISYLLMFSTIYIGFNKSFKVHNIISSLFSSMVLFIDIFGILYILRSDSFSRLLIIVFVVLAILKLILIILTLIKGVENNIKVMHEEKVIYKRKKVISFCLLEWGSIILLLISNLIYLLL